MEDEITFLTDFLTLEQARFKGHFDFSVTFDEDMDEEYINIPPMILQPYIENAILHGVRHLIDRQGFIGVHFSETDDEDYILCTITDNGVGRQQAAKMKTALQKQQHKSMGTAITQQRLKTLQQETGQEIDVTYTDLFNEQGTTCGTQVHIKLPVK